ncbi:hypothetical protein R3P38DRAFT_3221256 [Favolaschia claudopus]|uniref:Uncharacterized protein n=1 Tax=Favolaschia claudopus TaxID=2862362 RepID=A0AAW0A0X7_9AGAR
MDIGPIIPLDTYLEMLTTMFMSRAHRVRRIEIRAQVFAEWDAVFQTFASFSLSALQEVASSIDTCTYWGQRYGKIEHCVWGLPLRAQLKQVFPVFADTTLFSHLLDLKLDTISLDDTTLFLPALKSAVSLERLCARSVIVPSPMDNVIVELPALQRFTIYAAQDTALAWLACLSLPAVTYFSADLAYDDASSALHVSCKQFLSRVRKLDYHTSSTDIGTPPMFGETWKQWRKYQVLGVWSGPGS